MQYVLLAVYVSAFAALMLGLIGIAVLLIGILSVLAEIAQAL